MCKTGTKTLKKLLADRSDKREICAMQNLPLGGIRKKKKVL